MKHSPVRADLQVVRAVAVSAVVLYHLWPQFFPWGYLGVDVFFVLSGYLITGILIRDLSKPEPFKTRLAGFWARRARRLLPASLLAVLVTTLGAFLLAPASWFAQSYQGAIASAAYVQNWYLAILSVDYLQGDALVQGDASPFQQFWSLSVEEQFYIFWPFVIAFALLLARRWRFAVVAIIALFTIASFAYWLNGQFTTPEFTFFDTFGRVWQFGIGALFAIYLPGRTGLRAFSHRAWRPVTFIGDISYSLYLWHWPVIILAPWLLMRLDASAVAPIGYEWWLLLVSLVLALASKYGVEDPLRYGKLSALTSVKQIATTLLATVLVIATSWALGAYSEQSVRQSPAATQLTPPLGELAEDRPLVDSKAYRVGKGEDGFVVAEFGKRDSAIRVALVGDSHARQYFAPIEQVAEENGWALDVISKSACSVQQPQTYALFVTDPGFRYCEEWNQRLADYLQTNTYSLIVNTNSTLVHDNNPAVAVSFKAAVADWLDWGQRVVVLRDNPKPPAASTVRDFRICLEFAGQDFDSCAVPLDVAMFPHDGLADAAAEIESPSLTVFDPQPWFCAEGMCPVVQDGVIVFRDTSHVSDTFARTLADEFANLLVGKAEPVAAEE